MNKKYSFTLPILLAAMIVLGMLAGAKINPSKKHRKTDPTSKFREVLLHVDKSYIDTVNQDFLTEAAIREVVYELDPHSYYISKSEIKSVNQDLQGDFEGIGVEFNILNDTIIIVSPIAGGPSEALGIMAGDKIITIENENVAGIGITTTDVRNKLLGKKGSEVNIQILRKGSKRLLDFTITRDKIPIYSVDASYMVDDKIGYIKVNRFSAKTTEEFMDALKELKKEGMQDLILDLTGNPGGYLNAAFVMADQFFDSKKLIVYTEGRARPRKEYFSSHRGTFKDGRLAVLIDEGSASASEIVAGAIQDWDRGLIIGRRSFGKGLVQEQIELSDHSALRLTVAKYYTPSGRSIQKPYQGKNKSNYYLDVYHRYTNGELSTPDSIKFPDSLKFKTAKGRVVYGGGGITPDIFIPIDTLHNSAYLSKVLQKGIVYQFALYKTDQNRTNWENQYKDYHHFAETFQADKYLEEFVRFAEDKGVKRIPEDIETSGLFISTQIKALIGRQLFGQKAFYKIINQLNDDYLKAIEVLQSDQYQKLDLLTLLEREQTKPDKKN